jgi:adhesin transport system membrane fusion protein
MSQTTADPNTKRRDSAAIGALHTAAVDFSVPSAVSADLQRPLPGVLNALLLSLVALVGAFIVWAAFAVIEETTRGEGRVIPASKIQVVQNLEGGIVRALNVREGARVEAGDILLLIDPTQAGSDLGERRERILGLQAQVARLQAEVAGTSLAFPAAVAEAVPTLVARERESFKARRETLDAALSALALQEKQRAQEILELEARVENQQRALELARSELAILKPLAEKRAVARSEIIAAERRFNEADGQLRAAQLALPRVRAQRHEARDRRVERAAKFRADALQELTRARVELSALTEANRGTADTLARTTVRAPATGIVKTMHVNTVGQVVKPGSDLVEIVPVNDKLMIEARVRPQDIAFLRPGQPALVKLTAYDFALYGGLDGELVQIGADSVTNERGETYYLIRVRTEGSRLRHGSDSLPIIPGMVAQVDVKTGRKTVLAYLTKPLTRMRQDALSER